MDEMTTRCDKIVMGGLFIFAAWVFAILPFLYGPPVAFFSWDTNIVSFLQKFLQQWGVAITALTAIIAAVVGQWTTAKYNRRNIRIGTTVELLQRFNSADMFRQRNEVHAYLCEEKNRKKTFPRWDVHDEEMYFGKNDRNNDIEAGVLTMLYNIVAFYDHINILRKESRLDNRLLPRFFGGNFIYWYIVHFTREPLALQRSGMQEAASLEELKKWLEGYYKEDFQKWKEIADKALNKNFPDAKIS